MSYGYSQTTIDAGSRGGNEAGATSADKSFMDKENPANATSVKVFPGPRRVLAGVIAHGSLFSQTWFPISRMARFGRSLQRRFHSNGLWTRSVRSLRRNMWVNSFWFRLRWMAHSRHFPQLSPEAPHVWKRCRCDAEETRRVGIFGISFTHMHYCKFSCIFNFCIWS